MTFCFDAEIAQIYGVDEAIMIYNFDFWLRKNEANKKHYHDGRYWTYNSAEAFKELFPFWTAGQIRRILKSLQDKGVIVTGNYNQSAYDRTTWYAFSDSFLQKQQMHFSKSKNGEDENEKCNIDSANNKDIYIADNNPDNNATLFAGEQEQKKEKKPRGTSEVRECLFVDGRFATFEAFEAEMQKDEQYRGADLRYYFECVKNWSSSKGVKRKDWIATTKNWMLKDFQDGRLRKSQEGMKVSEAQEWADAIRRYQERENI